MTLWLIRAGSRGEHEQKFLQEGRVYMAWDGLTMDLGALPDRQALIRVLEERFPDETAQSMVNWSAQMWPFVEEMALGDWVVMPSKLQSGLYFGELTSGYHFEPAGPNPYYHWRSIHWFSGPIPRSVFPPDLLYSFGTFLTITRVHRQDAEARIRALAARHWQPEVLSGVVPRPLAHGQASPADEEACHAANVNLEELATDRIERLIDARFPGQELASLVELILQAEGFTTYRIPDGAEGGIAILAGGAWLGLGTPQICVAVQEGLVPVDRTTVDRLIEAGQMLGAGSCLVVSWGGFQPNVVQDLAQDFFRVRLWSRKQLLEKLLTHYDQLPESTRLALPLKRTWMVAEQDT